MSNSDSTVPQSPLTIEGAGAGKTVVLFSVPGAFTPTCDAKHLPGFVQHAAEFKAKGVDTIACMAGALAGAFRGITPSTAQSVGEKLDVTMMATILEFERRYPEAVRFQTV